MKRLLFGVVLAVAVFGVALLPGSVAADLTSPTQTTQVILSCNDGHSVSLSADPATLASLTAAVQSLNAGGSSCTLNTAPADPPSTDVKWTVYDYNASGQEIAPRNSPNSEPATTDGTGTTTFKFLDGHYTALLTTTDKTLTGDLSTKILSDDISVSGSAITFMTQHNGGDCATNFPASVRFYFISPSASGSSVGTPPAGFYTRFWWSNPVRLHLLAGNQGPTNIMAVMSDPNEWSDWNGTPANTPAVTGAFLEAIHKVQTVGLSFGGDCFFETGVQPGPTFAPERFTSDFSEEN